MASNIDPTVPTTGHAFTADVRSNFGHAKTEIEALQGVTAGSPFLPLIGGGEVNGPGNVPTVTIISGDGGAICNNGLDVIQTYDGGGLGMGRGVVGHTVSVRHGAETFADHFAVVFNTNPGFRPNGQYNNLESVLTIPAGSTNCNLTNAFTASVHDYGGTGALAATFYALAGASGTPTQQAVVWSQNSVCTDRSGNTLPAPLMYIRQQIENDYFVSHPSNTVRGTLNVLSALDVYAVGADGSPANPYPPLVSNTAVSWVAFSAGAFRGANPSAPWNVGFSSGNGASQVAMLIGTTNFATPGSPAGSGTTGNKSQPIEFYYTDNTTGSVQQYANLWVDPTFAGPTGTEFRITGDLRAPLVARVDLTIDNLAYFKSVNVAKTASLNLMGLDGQDHLSLGSGTARTIISSTNGVSAEFISGNPNSVNDVQIMGNAAGLPPQIQSHPAQGSPDTNIGLNIIAAGTGVLALQPGGSRTSVGGALTVVGALTLLNTSGPTLTTGSAAPSSTQPKGSIYLRSNGGVGSTLYVSQGGGIWNAVAAV